MRKVALRGIRDHKARFVLTTFAVVLGVSFVVASFVVADTLRHAFGGLFQEISAGVDLSVRSEDSFGAGAPGGPGARAPVPEELLAEVRAVSGVEAASGSLQRVGVQVITPEGEPVTTMGAPLLGVSWGRDDELVPVTIVAGQKPDEPGEVAVDRGTADDYDLAVGDQVQVSVPAGVVDARLVGIFTFGEANSLLGARLTAFETSTAQRLFAAEGTYDTIDIALESGASPVAVAARVQERLPEQLEVVSGQLLAEEGADDVNAFVDVFGGVLLGFAGVALFVSIFYIHNTFTIILGQRVRELGLLRAVGASPRQVMGSVLGEALVIGVVASAVGIAGGLALSVALRALLDAVGFGFPDARVVVQARTVVAAVVVGVAVTLLASVAPARRAGRIPPIAAIAGTGALRGVSGRRRLTAGVALTVGGLALLLFGLFLAQGAEAVLVTLVVGAIAVFVGVAVLSRLVAGPVARLLAAPLPRLLGATGRLARANAARNPTRTAAAASALMIGLAMVTLASVVGRSMTDTFAAAVEGTIRADVVVTGEGFSPFPPGFADALADRPEVGASTSIRQASFRIEGEGVGGTGVDPDGAAALLDLGVREGSLADLGPGSIAVQEDRADDLGVAVGDTLVAAFPRGGDRELRVAAVYSDSTLTGNHVLSNEGWPEKFSDVSAFLVLAGAAPGTAPEELEAVVAEVAGGFGALEVQDRAEFRESQEEQFAQILLAVNALLGLAVLIAALGIANTMALSVFERIRELGLLRAVGMTPRQARRMIRWESVVIAVFGGVLGVAIGTLFGVVSAVALPDAAADRVAVPVGSLVVTVVAAGVVGLLAAIFPARRAGRLDVLAAISHE